MGALELLGSILQEMERNWCLDLGYCWLPIPGSEAKWSPPLSYPWTHCSSLGSGLARPSVEMLHNGMYPSQPSSALVPRQGMLCMELNTKHVCCPPVTYPPGPFARQVAFNWGKNYQDTAAAAFQVRWCRAQVTLTHRALGWMQP